VHGAIGTLIRLRHIRVAGQHSDARHKAVAVFREIGLRFPPVRGQAWAHVAGTARGALDELRDCQLTATLTADRGELHSKRRGG
jgi:hypothetical protein